MISYRKKHNRQGAKIWTQCDSRLFRILLNCSSILVLVIFILNIPVNAQNQNISSGLVFDGEPYLAINPLDDQHLVVAWMGFKFGEDLVIKTKFSTDGGSSWSAVKNLPHQVTGNSSADPSLQFDKNGNVFLCYIDYDRITFTNGAIYVTKSTDSGATWNAAVEAISLSDCPGKYCVDRPWMEIDRSNGPNAGTIYVTSMNADQNVLPPYNPYLSVSTDGGLSFQLPRLMDTTGFLAGSLIPQPMPSPAIGADGTFYATYPSYVLTQNLLPTLILASSNNAGTSLSHQVIQTYSAGSVVSNEFAKKAGYFFTDETDASHMALVTLSKQNGDPDVLFSESFDKGVSWTDFIRVNQDPISNGAMQDLMWADFNANGDLAITWRDRRQSGDTSYKVPTEIYAAVRLKNDTVFREILLSDQVVSHDTILEGSGNDFMCVELVGNDLYAVWGDVRTSRLNIFLTKMNIQDATSITTVVHQTQLLKSFPNPASSIVRFKGVDNNVAYVIHNIKGIKIREGRYADHINVSGLSKGIYFVSFENPQFAISRIVVE